MKIDKIVIVHWEDAGYNEQIKVGDEREKGYLATTAGYLVSENNDVINIACEFFHELNEWRHITTIPKEVIRFKKVIDINPDFTLESYLEGKKD